MRKFLSVLNGLVMFVGCFYFAYNQNIVGLFLTAIVCAVAAVILLKAAR